MRSLLFSALALFVGMSMAPRAQTIDLSKVTMVDLSHAYGSSTAADVAQFEKAHGRVARGTIVLLRTGWSPDSRTSPTWIACRRAAHW
jgi:hypothetical protein